MRSGRRFTDFANAINRYCERKSPTPLRHPAISKTSCAISLRWSRRNVWENFTEYKEECAIDSNHDQGNQNLSEVRRQDLFRRAGRALRQMCAENRARGLPGRC